MMAHALLGPSSAKQWMACTPSPRFSLEFEEKPSEYAAEGTAAHEYAELFLLAELGGNDTLAVATIEAFAKNNQYYNGEMEEAIGLYLDIVHERFQALYKLDHSTMLMAEQRLNFSEWVPEGFGTGDVVIIGAGIIEVIDLKYGKGVPVDAKDNPQLRLYGLGAWNTYKILYDIERVRTTIVQPRLGSVTTDEISVNDLVKWAEDEVAPRAKLAWAGEGEYVPGDHCRFCKAKPRCKALADYNMEIAKHDFALPHKLTDADIVEILERVDRLASWVTSIKEYALDQAVNHNIKWPGWKLVEGRSNRFLNDADAAAQKMIAEGVQEPLIYKPRQMLGITALEKLIGKKKFTTLLADLISKPPGKPTLAPETDKRAEFNTAANAVADFTEEAKK